MLPFVPNSSAARSSVIVFLAAAAVLAALAICGCAATLKRDVEPAERILTTDQRSPLLKAHLRDGSLLILYGWSLDPPASREGRWKGSIDPTGVRLLGSGRMLDPARALIREGSLSVPLDSVLLVETNAVAHEMPTALKAIAITLGVIVAVLVIVCAIDPKACFGSCPTFYVSDGTRPLLQAEGFSASVMPALEATDVDALALARPASRAVQVTMRNEALETHVVRSVRLLAAPHAPGDRVFATPRGEFYAATSLAPPAHAAALEGDCAATLRELDAAERFSRADSTDLAARETLDLTFTHPPAGDVGLVIGCRQTLLTTYLFYQTLAFMGSNAGEWMSRVERGDRRALNGANAVGRMLGGIEVQVRDAAGAWTTVDTLGETGPLATDVQLARLPRATAAPYEVRLRMVRGMWRLDWIALATLGARVEPVRLDPVKVTPSDAPGTNLLASMGADRTLVTTRGESYVYEYRLPGEPSGYDLFLESRGYYLEWMREEWRADENPMRAARMFVDPAGMLRELAPEFKKREVEMESLFWASRYAFP